MGLSDFYRVESWKILSYISFQVYAQAAVISASFSNIDFLTLQFYSLFSHAEFTSASFDVTDSMRSRFYGSVLPLRDPGISLGWHNCLKDFHAEQIVWSNSAAESSWNKFRMTEHITGWIWGCKSYLVKNIFIATKIKITLKIFRSISWDIPVANFAPK